MSDLTYLDSVILGIVEGVTEFLPVSSTGHLTIVEKMLGLQVNDPAITAYTAIIQFGAIIATFLYFRTKIWRMLTGLLRGVSDAGQREHPDFRLGLAVLVGSIPVVVMALLLKDVIKGPLRSLWVVAAALILWSAVMWWAERRHTHLVEAQADKVGDQAVSLRDGLIIGLTQCFSLIPGVSRSGATISAGLARGLDRVTATEMSFFMAIPALTGATVFELKDVDPSVVGWGQLAVGMAVSFVVAYASIAWLLRFVRNNSLTAFIGYRVLLGLGLIAALGAGCISAT